MNDFESKVCVVAITLGMMLITVLIARWNPERAKKIAACVCGCGGRFATTKEELWLSVTGISRLHLGTQIEMLSRWEGRDPVLLLNGLRGTTLSEDDIRCFGQLRNPDTCGKRREWLFVLHFVHGSMIPTHTLVRLYDRETDTPLLQDDELKVLGAQSQETRRALAQIFIRHEWYELLYPEITTIFRDALAETPVHS